MTVCVCVCILKNGCVRNPSLCYVFAVRDLRKRGGRIESRSQKRGTVIASGGKRHNYKDLAPWVKLHLCLKWFGFLLFIFWGFFFSKCQNYFAIIISLILTVSPDWGCTWNGTDLPSSHAQRLRAGLVHKAVQHKGSMAPLSSSWHNPINYKQNSYWLELQVWHSNC